MSEKNWYFYHLDIQEDAKDLVDVYSRTNESILKELGCITGYPPVCSAVLCTHKYVVGGMTTWNKSSSIGMLKDNAQCVGQIMWKRKQTVNKFMMQTFGQNEDSESSIVGYTLGSPTYNTERGTDDDDGVCLSAIRHNSCSKVVNVLSCVPAPLERFSYIFIAKDV